MRFLISERKLGLAIWILALGIFLAIQASFFTSPVLISEKGLMISLLSIGLMVTSVFVACRSVRKAK